MTGISILERNRKHIILIHNLIDLIGGGDHPGDVQCALKHLFQDAQSLWQCIDERHAQDDLADGSPFLRLFEGLLQGILAFALEMHSNRQGHRTTGLMRMKMLRLERQLQDFAYNFLTRTSSQELSLDMVAMLNCQGTLEALSPGRDVPDKTVWEIMSEPNLDRDQAPVSWSRLLEWSLSPPDESLTENRKPNDDGHNGEDIIEVPNESTGKGNHRVSHQSMSSKPMRTTLEDNPNKIFDEVFALTNGASSSIMPASYGDIIGVSPRETWQRVVLSPCPSPEPIVRVRRQSHDE
jgi:hypothetical protein